MSPQHHFILKTLPMEPVSRTYQYRKIVKPILERKRRGRINKCLEELKDLMTGTLQADGENISKLEKADILELTVRHLQRLRERNALFIKQQDTPTIHMEKFWSGFQHCASEVAQFLNKYDRNITTNLIQYIANYIPNNVSQIQAINRNNQINNNNNNTMHNNINNATIKIALRQSLNMPNIRIDERAVLTAAAATTAAAAATAAIATEHTTPATAAYCQRLDMKPNNSLITSSSSASTSTTARFHQCNNNTHLYSDCNHNLHHNHNHSRNRNHNHNMCNMVIMPTALCVKKEFACPTKRHHVWRPW